MTLATTRVACLRIVKKRVMGQITSNLNKLWHMLRNPGEQRQFLTGAASVFILQIGGVGTAYLLQVLLANVMGTRDFGDYIYAYNALRLLALFGGMGLTLSVLKFVPDYLAEQEWGLLQGLLRAFSGVTVAASTVLAVAAIAFFTVFPPADINRTTLVIGLLITPLFGLLYLYVDLLRGMNFYTLAYAPLSIGQNTIMLALAGGAFLLTGQVDNVLAISMLSAVTCGIVLFQIVTILRNLPAAARGVRAVYDLGVWLRTSLPMLFIKGFDVVMDRIDVLIVGFALGAVPAGIYAVASRTANLAIFPLVAVNSVTAPRISPLYKQGKLGEINQLVRRATLLSLGVSSLAVVGIIALSHPLLRFFGEEFLVGQRTLIILALGYLINAATGPVSLLLSMTGYERVNGRIYGVVVACNIVLNVSLLTFTDWGIEGVALATALTIALRNVWLYIEVRRRLGINTLPLP